MNLSIYNTNLSNVSNLAKSYLFMIEFFGFHASKIAEFKDISLYVRTAKYPPVTTSTGEVFFYGQKKTFISKVTYSGILEISFDEYQNNIVSDFLEYESFSNYKIYEDGTVHQNLNNSKENSIITLSIFNDGR